MMTEYGSVQYFANFFADIVCEVAADEPHLGENMVAGFREALLA